MKGKGFPGKHPGDQIVVLQVAMPEQHTPEAEKLYETLAELEKDFNPRSPTAAPSPCAKSASVVPATRSL